MEGQIAVLLNARYGRRGILKCDVIAVVVQSQTQVCRPIHINVQVAAAEYQGRYQLLLQVTI